MEVQEALYIKPKRKPSIRELTLLHGVDFPSDAELIMLMLGSGTQELPIEKLAHKVLVTVEDSNKEQLVDRLRGIKGMGGSKALAVAAALEFGRRRCAHLRAVINKPGDIIPYIQHYSIEPKEHFVCVSMNGAHEIIKIRVVSVGTISRTLIHPREIFSEPVAEHASAVICCHNHPSGPCIPSEADRESTKKLLAAADILGITFLDHIIVTPEAYFSFLEHGLLAKEE